MRDFIKITIAVVVSLMVAFPVGYLIGVSGKGSLREQLDAAQSSAQTARSSLETQGEAVSQQQIRCRTDRLLLIAKNELLTAEVQIFAANFGLASQHLSRAAEHFKKAKKDLSAAQGQTIDQLVSRISETILVAGRFDPMARSYIEKIMAQLDEAMKERLKR